MTPPCPCEPEYPTARALAFLTSRKPGLRNCTRAWLSFWLDEGRSPSINELALRMGRSRGGSGNISQCLMVLAGAGIITWGQGDWRKASLVPGLDAALLLDGLGREFEVVLLGGVSQQDCPDCGAVRHSSKPGCPLCRILTLHPWKRQRLEYYAERAAARLPLYDPADPPPWASDEDTPARITTPAEEDEA